MTASEISEGKKLAEEWALRYPSPPIHERC